MERFNGFVKPGSGAAAGCPGAVSRAGPKALAWLALAALLLAGLAAGCGVGKIPKTNYYVLNLPAPQNPASDSLPYTAVLMPLSASRMLAQDRIVYRETKQEIGFYEYHRWAEDPRTSIESALLSQLRARGTFRSIVPFEGRTTADYIIRGRLERLEEVDYNNGVSVHVKISAELLDGKTGRALWDGSGEATDQVSAAEVRNVVISMSEAAQSSVAKLAEDLDAYLRAKGSATASASPAPPQAAQK